MNELKLLKKITGFIDNARWKDKRNYFELNYANPIASTNELILSHYITYITDRQMPFKRIWDVGGFVFSSLVNAYAKGENIDNLLSESAKFSNIKDGQLYFRSDKPMDQDSESYMKVKGDISNNEVKFCSRFVTTDYRCIYNTLYILSKIANRSIIEYIKKIIKLNIDHKDDIVKRIAYGLYILTYENVKNKNVEKLQDYVHQTKEFAEQQYKIVMEKLTNKEDFEKGYNIYLKKQIYTSKRIWCSLRDYMKDIHYREKFKKEIKPTLRDDICELYYLKQLELPGDVWNNNSKFLQCNFDNKNSTPFNKYLREFVYSGENDEGENYVEQFDITFSFAPRMCEQDMCDICPYALIKKDSQIEKLCINDSNKLCPIMLCSTGYRMSCVGKERCMFIKLIDK